MIKLKICFLLVLFFVSIGIVCAQSDEFNNTVLQSQLDSNEDLSVDVNQIILSDDECDESGDDDEYEIDDINDDDVNEYIKEIKHSNSDEYYKFFKYLTEKKKV